MRSDNGTNFVRGEKELYDAIAERNQHKTQETLLQKSIDWRFNLPPAAGRATELWSKARKHP